MKNFHPALSPDESAAGIEAEERLAALTDQGARFVELVAAGHPVDEAFARAGYAEGSALILAQRPEILAAVGALRERNLGTARTDVAYLRRVTLGVAHAAHRDGDQRVALSAVRLLAEIDGHLHRDPALDNTPTVNVQINIGQESATATAVVVPADLDEVLR